MSNSHANSLILINPPFHHGASGKCFHVKVCVGAWYQITGTTGWPTLGWQIMFLCCLETSKNKRMSGYIFMLFSKRKLLKQFNILSKTTFFFKSTLQRLKSRLCNYKILMVCVLLMLASARKSMFLWMRTESGHQKYTKTTEAVTKQPQQLRCVYCRRLIQVWWGPSAGCASKMKLAFKTGAGNDFWTSILDKIKNSANPLNNSVLLLADVLVSAAYGSWSTQHLPHLSAATQHFLDL